MAYTQMKEFGRFDTDFTTEEVVVQAVEITGKSRTAPVRHRIDIREFVKKESYTGFGKKAFVFTDPDQLDYLAEALREAATYIRNGYTDAPKVREPRKRSKQSAAKTNS